MWLVASELITTNDPSVAYWSIAGNVVAILGAAAAVIAWVRRWANKYLGDLVTRTLTAQGDIMKSTGDIADGVKNLAGDVKSLSTQVERLIMRIDTTDRRLDDHIREAETRNARFELHMADHYLHGGTGPSRRR